MTVLSIPSAKFPSVLRLIASRGAREDGIRTVRRFSSEIVFNSRDAAIRLRDLLRIYGVVGTSLREAPEKLEGAPL